jgi:hypothetical protein
MNSNPNLYDDAGLVLHPKRPEWGPGRILDRRGPKVVVYFRDLGGDEPESAVRTIDTNVVALHVVPGKQDAILDNLPPYRDGKFARPLKKRVTLGEGLIKFQALFPRYFEDPRYIGDLHAGERAYKWAAHELFAESLGEGKLASLLAAGDVEEARRRALTVEGRTNLLAVFEKAALRDGLRADDAAYRFLRSLDDLLAADSPGADEFEAYAASIERLPGVEGKTDPAKWTVATVLPYLAQPKRFMFLKPEVTKDCATRLTFDLGYVPRLNWRTYARLLTMSEYLLEHLRPYGARDYIDVQSFIWVIGGGGIPDPSVGSRASPGAAASECGIGLSNSTQSARGERRDAARRWPRSPKP